MKISDEILDILSQCRVEKNILFLPTGRMDRQTYLAVNKVLENMGGKWNRKAQGHIFEANDNPAERLETVLSTREISDLKEEFQYFHTPRPIAEMMCGIAELDKSSHVLEPSIGDGRLAEVIMEHRPAGLFGVEINPDMYQKLEGKPYPVLLADFLTVTRDSLPFSVNRVIMNPPFHNYQDIAHIYHAYDLMQNDGILVSIVSESPFFRADKKAVFFRSFLEDHCAETVKLDAGAFHESGTEIRSRIITIRKEH